MEWEDTPADEARARRDAEIASLTGLRGFAALMVVLIHTSGRTEFDWLGLPTYGPVSLFVISGFLLYRPWARWSLGLAGRPDLGTFVLKRATRIFPAYWLVLVVVAVVIPASRPADAGGWWRAFSLTWIYRVEPMREAMLHTWSLATEVSWYVALPVMGFLGGRLARRYSGITALWICVSFLALAVPLSIGWRLWTSEADLAGQLTYPYWLPSFLVCFAGGALVAVIAEAHRASLISIPGIRSFCADPWVPPVVTLCLALVATSSLGGPTGFVPVTFAEEQVRTWSSALIALLLLSVVVLGPNQVPTNRVLSTKWFVAVGRWSYGIYLWHVPVIVVLERDITFSDGPIGLLWRLTWVLGISIALGAVTYAWVERPTIEWARRLDLGSVARRCVLDRRETTNKNTTAQPSVDTPAASRSTSPDE